MPVSRTPHFPQPHCTREGSSYSAAVVAGALASSMAYWLDKERLEAHNHQEGIASGVVVGALDRLAAGRHRSPLL